MLENLEPKRLWYFFEEITKIPRCSKDERRAGDYVISAAKENGLDYDRDGAGNIVVRKPGSSGHEKTPITVLQCHLDMVCEKNADVEHDFSGDPLKVKIEGENVTAEGTTLGADNGIGMAACLAIMESEDMVHGPLEFLFTVDEETGMTGAMELDTNMLKGRRLLNLDGEEDDTLIIGCAGGRDTVIELSLGKDRELVSGCRFGKLSVTGLTGGHSGLDIGRGKGNAIVLLGRLLAVARKDVSMRLVSVDGGSKRNAIPREASAVVCYPDDKDSLLREIMPAMEQIFRNELKGVDGGVKITLDRLEESDLCPVGAGDDEKIVNLLNALPHGVTAMSKEVPGLIETSTNLAVVSTTEGCLRIDTSQRSSVESRNDEIAFRVASIARLAGARVEFTGEYPGWEPDRDSEIVSICAETYRELFGESPKIEAIHAGVECGLLGERIGGMDMVSFGPLLENPHSPDELVNIETVRKFWKLLLRVLEKTA